MNQKHTHAVHHTHSLCHPLLAGPEQKEEAPPSVTVGEESKIFQPQASCLSRGNIWAAWLYEFSVQTTPGAMVECVFFLVICLNPSPLRIEVPNYWSGQRQQAKEFDGGHS